MTTPESSQPLGIQPPPHSGDRPSATGGHGKPDHTETHGPGPIKRTASGIKRALLVLVGALAALFAVANRQDVEVHWIFGSAVQTPLILALVVTFVAGAIIGWLSAKLGGRSRS